MIMIGPLTLVGRWTGTVVGVLRKRNGGLTHVGQLTGVGPPPIGVAQPPDAGPTNVGDGGWVGAATTCSDPGMHTPVVTLPDTQAWPFGPPVNSMNHQVLLSFCPAARAVPPVGIKPITS